MIDFKADANALYDELVARRRDFHSHPELGFQEVRTAAIVAEELNSLGLEVQTGVGKTGVVAVLEGDQDGPTVMYRADMDALPILEENEVDYASQTPGVMHACGHDGHTSIALGVAKLLSQRRGDIAGRIKFVFQPAEEGGGGARAMISDGVLNDPAPDVVLGLHLWNTAPVGTVCLTEGSLMAGGARIELVVTGKGGHGALPHTTIDPVVATVQLISALYMIVPRKLDVLEQAAVLSLTSVETSSKAFNVIPEQVTVRGTFRILDMAAGQLIEQQIRDISKAVCAAAGCSVEVTVEFLTTPVINDAGVVSRLRPVFAGLVGEEHVDGHTRTMASEDVSFLVGDKPGTYFFVGSANPARGLTYGHHHPRFDFDEDALPLGVALMSAALADYVMSDGA